MWPYCNCDFLGFMPPRSRLCAQGRCKAVRPFWVPNGQPCWTLVPWPGLSSAKATSGHSPPPLLLQLSHQPGYKWLRRPRVFSLRCFLFYYSFPLAVLGLHRCTGFSPVAQTQPAGWSSFPVKGSGPPRSSTDLWAPQARGLVHCGSPVHGSCS